jgi:DNA-binding transcriptional regulator YiaG
MSSLAFRNVEVAPSDPVSAWPTEAIQTALERGGLSDWQQLAAEIGARPWGRVARQIEEVLGYSRAYGASELMERVIDRARTEAEREERVAVAQEVSSLVEKSGLSRVDFASRIGTSASRLSTYATGKVTPSAALMVRMRTEAEAAGELDPKHPRRAI